jgi:pyruvate dehydrogenase E2 component (dihydrolipoamide acetyltransferase)
MAEFRMPSLGADMDVGTVVEWLVKPGDTIRRGQVMAVVDTAKAAMEIEAFESGVLDRILVEVGTQVPVGTPLAIIATTAARREPEPVAPAVGAATTGAPSRPRPTHAARRRAPGPEQSAARPRPASPPVPDSAPPAPAPDEVRRATPPVRHLAHQLGVDLAALPGSGPGGHVTHEDVLAAADAGRVPEPGPTTAEVVPPGRLRASPRARRLAAERGIDLTGVAGSGSGSAVLAADVESASKAPAAGTGEALARPTPRAADPQRRAAMRSAIATLMARSNTEIPHYYVQQTMDLGPALAWLRAANSDLPAARRLLPAVLFLRATVLAAVAVPDLNGHWVDDGLRTADRVDLGVAVATRGGGLITPAIPDAAPLGVHDLMARLADLVARARRGTLKQAEMAGASITVSSLGENGPDALAGVIFPPQVALVGVGGIVERPWAVDGMLTVRPTATITLAADHRASDGRTASAFLAAFAHALAHPEEL